MLNDGHLFVGNLLEMMGGIIIVNEICMWTNHGGGGGGVCYVKFDCLGVKYLRSDFFWVKYLIFNFVRGSDIWYLIFRGSNIWYMIAFHHPPPPHARVWHIQLILIRSLSSSNYFPLLGPFPNLYVLWLRKTFSVSRDLAIIYIYYQLCSNSSRVKVVWQIKYIYQCPTKMTTILCDVHAWKSYVVILSH